MNSESNQGLKILAFIAILALIVGCSEETVTSRPRLYPVRGKILIDGVPPVGASIKFVNQIRKETVKRGSSATVGEDGTFMASTYEQDDGMPPGKYAACVFWLEAPQGGGMMVDRLRGEFMDLNNPIITFEVVATEVELGELRLKTSVSR